MHVLCLSQELDFFPKITTAFSGRILKVDCRSTPLAFLGAAASGTWDVFLIDFDLLGDDYLSPLDFSSKLGPDAKVLIIASSKWADQREPVEAARQMLLLKPLVIGEIGLALQKLHKQKKTLNAPLPPSVHSSSVRL